MNYLGVFKGKLLSNALEIGVGHADNNAFFVIFNTWLRFCPVKCELKIFWITDIFLLQLCKLFREVKVHAEGYNTS